MPEITPVKQFELSIDEMLLANGTPSNRPLCGGCPPNYSLETSEAVIMREYFDRADKRIIKRSVAFGEQLKIYAQEGSTSISREIAHKIGGLASRQARDLVHGFATSRRLGQDEQLQVVNWLSTTISTPDLLAKLGDLDDAETKTLQDRTNEALKLDKSVAAGNLSSGLTSLFANRPSLVPEFRNR